MELAIYLFKLKVEKIDVKTFRIMLDKNISLMEYFQSSMPSKNVVNTMMNFLSVKPENITFNLVINSIAEANPAAYNLIIKHPNGNKWLNKTMEDLRTLYI